MKILFPALLALIGLGVAIQAQRRVIELEAQSVDSSPRTQGVVPAPHGRLMSRDSISGELGSAGVAHRSRAEILAQLDGIMQQGDLQAARLQTELRRDVGTVGFVVGMLLVVLQLAIRRRHRGSTEGPREFARPASLTTLVASAACLSSASAHGQVLDMSFTGTIVPNVPSSQPLPPIGISVGDPVVVHVRYDVTDVTSASDDGVTGSYGFAGERLDTEIRVGASTWSFEDPDDVSLVQVWNGFAGIPDRILITRVTDDGDTFPSMPTGGNGALSLDWTDGVLPLTLTAGSSLPADVNEVSWSEASDTLGRLFGNDLAGPSSWLISFSIDGLRGRASGIRDSSCNGDGGDQLGCTDCPCSNNATPGTVGGCLNSAGTSSRLEASGDPSVSLSSGDTTDLRFTMIDGPPVATSVLLSGDAVAPTNMANPCFGLDSGSQASDRDGLRCAVQNVQRHGNRQTNAMGNIQDSAGPSRVWGGEAQPNAGIAGASGYAAGQTRYFQITHRDDPAQVCMRGLNTSQLIAVTFGP
ncbi:MAG: hypothetical protein KDC38_12235 [Planctomycetes bacterium]|nr:hypothetical protein [Planctomycetota bacterium]